MSVLISIAAIGLLILIHELGHFFAARWLGVGVTDFSIGFGKKIFTREIGGTAYSLSMIPIGGYVRMLDEKVEEGEGPPGKPISEASPYARIAIALAGPCTNILFTLLAYLWIVTSGIPHQTTLIGTVFPNTPAAAANFQPGDRILSVNGKPTRYWEEMLAGVAEADGAPVALLISRKGEELTTTVTPSNSNGRWLLGVRAAGKMTKEQTPVKEILPRTLAMTTSDVKAAIDSFAHLFSNIGQLGGPIMIAQVGAERVRMGATAMLMFMAFLSANLFVLNMFPLPALDGGSIVFNLWEGIFGKPLPAKLKKWIMATGSAFVLVLVTVVVFGDVVKLFR